MSFGNAAEKLLGQDHRLHPTGEGFVVQKAMRHAWFHLEPTPSRGIKVSGAEHGALTDADWALHKAELARLTRQLEEAAS